MLGVSYPSLAAIDVKYVKLGEDTSFASFASKIDINMRSVVRLHGWENSFCVPVLKAQNTLFAMCHLFVCVKL